MAAPGGVDAGFVSSHDNSSLRWDLPRQGRVECRGDATVVEVQICQRDEALVCATWGSTFINHWHGPPTSHHLRELERVEAVHIAAHGRIGVITLLDPRIGRQLSPEARKVANEVAGAADPYMDWHAFLVLGSGLFAALARSVITGITWMHGSKFPTQVFSEGEKAEEWILSHLAQHGTPSTPEELAEVFVQVRQHGVSLSAR